MGAESIVGVPMQVVANLIIGFVVFGIALTITGGGEFFMNFATALMGRSRGGRQGGRRFQCLHGQLIR